MEAASTELSSPPRAGTGAGSSTVRSPKKQLGVSGTPKARSRRQGAKVAKAHPSYSQMIKEAIVALKDRKGSSRVAILKYISGRYQLGSNGKRVHSQLRLAIKRGIASGKLTIAKGGGANGSFRLSSKVEPKEPKRLHERTKKVTEKKATDKSATVKKPRKKKATGAKKSPQRKLKSNKPKPKVSKTQKAVS
uniref:H15 domain-containing protein n=1 Tax=Setaria digitata TaxID=48799 RepID=A0A915PSR3_9BILA